MLISGHFSPARVAPVLLAGCSDSFTSRTMNGDNKGSGQTQPSADSYRLYCTVQETFTARPLQYTKVGGEEGKNKDRQVMKIRVQ